MEEKVTHVKEIHC